MQKCQTLMTTSCHKTPYGYLTGSGYMGWVPFYNCYILFCTEKEYLDYIKEDERNEKVS